MLAVWSAGYGLWCQAPPVEAAVASGYSDAGFVAVFTNDPLGAIDPGYDKDVAQCVAVVLDYERVSVALDNAYPSYTCTFTATVKNFGTVPLRVGPVQTDAPPVLTVDEVNGLTGVVLEPGEQDVEQFSVHVEQQAQQRFIYSFTIRKPFALFISGTMGFWKNWDRHNTFTEAQIVGWLTQIDASSAWLGPTTVTGMEAVFDAALGKGATPRSRFLAQYLATRLNERAGILGAGDKHNVSGLDPGNYLGLGSPKSATTSEIVAAIETKFGTSPTDAQFTVMKDICDALNNLAI